jgi:hypothetical protein
MRFLKMEKLIDAFYWLLNNPKKAKKVWISILVILFIVTAFIAVNLIAAIPTVIESSITKE